MDDGGDRIPAERFFETAAAQIRVDLPRLTFDRGFDGRIVQQHNRLLGSETRQRRLELERFVDRFVHELFDDGLSPGTKRPSAESTREPLDAGKSDPLHFAGIAVENVHAVVDENLTDLLFVPGFEI